VCGDSPIHPFALSTTVTVVLDLRRAQRMAVHLGIVRVNDNTECEGG
jgi:hypothetical protein